MEEERHPAAVYSAHHSHPCVHCLGDVISPSQGRKNLPCTPKLRIPQSLVISWIAIQGLSKYFPLKRNTILSFLAEHKISDSTGYAMSCSHSVLHYYQSQSQGNSWSREQKPCIWPIVGVQSTSLLTAPTHLIWLTEVCLRLCEAGPTAKKIYTWLEDVPSILPYSWCWGAGHKRHHHPCRLCEKQGLFHLCFVELVLLTSLLHLAVICTHNAWSALSAFYSWPWLPPWEIWVLTQLFLQPRRVAIQTNKLRC